MNTRKQNKQPSEMLYFTITYHNINDLLAPFL